MLRRVLAIAFVTAALATAFTQSPASAECTVNLGGCTATGDCYINAWSCYNGGHCDVNAGTCNGGDCTVHYGNCSGTCIVNVGTCAAGEYCLVKVLICTDSVYEGPVCQVLAARAGTYGPVVINGQGDVYVAGEWTWDCPPYGS